MSTSPPSPGAWLLERFAQKNPLAAGLRLVFERLFDTEALNALFETHRDQQYTQQILFATIVEVMLVVVTRKVDSVHAALQQRKKRLGASITAFYSKLNGTEPGVAEALVRHSFERGRALVAEMGGTCERMLGVRRVRILDGNHLAATERRLAPLWSVAAGPLPGLALAVFDPVMKMISEVLLCEDGHAQERSLTDRILALVERGDCWVADRNFCTHAILFGILKRSATFVIRQHANLTGELLDDRRACGRCEGGVLFEQSLRLTYQDTTRVVRRITVVLEVPTRDGECEVHLVTTLPSRVGAATIARIYLKRWMIETAFAELAQWLHSEIEPLGYPRAALLGFCVAVMAYNSIGVMLGALRARHGEAVVQDTVSGYYIAQYGRDAVGGVDALIEPEDWRSWQELSLPAAAELLKGIAARIDLDLLRKHKRGPKKSVPPRTRFKGKPHVSTYKLLNGIEQKGE